MHMWVCICMKMQWKNGYKNVGGVLSQGKNISGNFTFFLVLFCILVSKYNRYITKITIFVEEKFWITHYHWQHENEASKSS